MFRFQRKEDPSACSELHGVGIAKELFQLAPPHEILEVGVAANVLLVDEGVGDGPLAGDGLERILDGGTVGCWRLAPRLTGTFERDAAQRRYEQCFSRIWGFYGCAKLDLVKLTQLVKLVDGEVCAELLESPLRRLAVRTVRLGKDH